MGFIIYFFLILWISSQLCHANNIGYRVNFLLWSSDKFHKCQYCKECFWIVWLSLYNVQLTQNIEPFFSLSFRLANKCWDSFVDFMTAISDYLFPHFSLRKILFVFLFVCVCAREMWNDRFSPQFFFFSCSSVIVPVPVTDIRISLMLYANFHVRSIRMHTHQ